MADRPQCLGVHDPLSVRALALRSGGTTVVLAVVDVIGLQRPHLQRLRQAAALPGVPAPNILIGATHNHSGPDLMGIWNGSPPKYREYFDRQVVACLRQAVARLAPATVAAARFDLPPRMVINWRNLDQLDPTGQALIFRTPTGQTVATLVNFACHAEVMNTHKQYISADFPGALRRHLEQEFGGTALFANGALGGMVSPAVDDKTTTWDDVERFGRTFAQAAITALRQATPVTGKLTFKSREIVLPVDNPRYRDLALKIGRKDMLGGKVTTEVAELRLGPVQLVTIPAELLPKVGLQLKAMMDGEFKFQLGLTNDELGYIIPPEAFDPKRYEESVSPGASTTPALLAEFAKLLGK